MPIVFTIVQVTKNNDLESKQSTVGAAKYGHFCHMAKWKPYQWLH